MQELWVVLMEATKIQKKYYIYIILLIVISAIYFLYDPLKTTIFPQCPTNKYLGFYCPGCGSQRALHSFLHFDIKKTFSYNILFIPALLVFIYNLVCKINNRFSTKKINNVVYHPKFPIIVLVIVLLFMILRNIPFEPFNYLAP